MRLGGPVFETYDSPEMWIAALKSLGYRAAYCPVSLEASADTIRAYASAAAEADIAIAEVGAWCNPLSPDEAIRREALDKCKRSLALADAIGARCCVNIAGSRGSKWDGPCPEDLTDDAFDGVVESVRVILDDVRPLRPFYTLKPCPDVSRFHGRLSETVARGRPAALRGAFRSSEFDLQPPAMLSQRGSDPGLYRPVGPAYPVLPCQGHLAARPADRSSGRGAPRPRRSRLSRLFAGLGIWIRTCP